jgi:hypothetical protein
MPLVRLRALQSLWSDPVSAHRVADPAVALPRSSPSRCSSFRPLRVILSCAFAPLRSASSRRPAPRRERRLRCRRMRTSRKMARGASLGVCSPFATSVPVSARGHPKPATDPSSSFVDLDGLFHRAPSRLVGSAAAFGVRSSGGFSGRTAVRVFARRYPLVVHAAPSSHPRPEVVDEIVRRCGARLQGLDPCVRFGLTGSDSSSKPVSFPLLSFDLPRVWLARRGIDFAMPPPSTFRRPRRVPAARGLTGCWSSSSPFEVCGLPSPEECSGGASFPFG